MRFARFGIIFWFMIACVPAMAEVPDVAVPDSVAGRNLASPLSTQVFDHWNLICTADPSGDQGPLSKKYCEVSQVIYDDAQKPVVHIAVALDKLSKRTIAVVIPANIQVNSPVSLKIEGSSANIEARFKSCSTTGCFADGDLLESGLIAMRVNSKNKATLDVVNASGTMVHVPVELLGFAAAWQAYLKQAR